MWALYEKREIYSQNGMPYFGRKNGSLPAETGGLASLWNVDSLTGRAGEVVEVLSDRKVDVACIQET